VGRATRLANLRQRWGQPRKDAARGGNLDAIAEYHRARATPATGLDDRTWTDLDLDAVFTAIDHTTSTIGQQVLYHRLRTTPAAADLPAFEALVTRMTEDPDARERAQLALERLQSPSGYDLWWLGQADAIASKPWHVVFPLLAALVATFCVLLVVSRGALLLIAAAAMVNLFVRGATARRIGTVLGAFRQLGPLLYAARATAFLANPADPLTAPLQSDLPHLARLGSVARWVSRDPLAAGELGGMLLEYLNLLFLLDANALYFAARELRHHGAALLRVAAAVGEIDAAIAIASYRDRAPKWTRPRFGAAGDPAALEGIRHPLLADAVPNSIALAPPHGVLITGSNMSGKSTFLRTVGVTTVMAQTINTCLADRYDAPVYCVRSCIGRADDLLSGKSYYLAEVEAVLALVRAAAGDTPHLLLFDELFRGTNAVERIAAGEAVLAQLLASGRGRPPHVVIAATHDAELVELLAGQYAPFHFTDRMDADGLTFDFTLQPGPATTRNAIALLRLYGAPAALVARALARSEGLDRQRAAARERDAAQPRPDGLGTGGSGSSAGPASTLPVGVKRDP
jgi:hypothetical protein